MKYLCYILMLPLVSCCTPTEIAIAEEVLEDVKELEEGARAPVPPPQNGNWTAPPPSAAQTKFQYANQRQYPPRHEKNPGFGRQNSATKHGC